MLTTTDKQALIQQAQTFISDNNISQNTLAKESAISVAYLSDMMNGKTTTGKKDTPIADKYYYQLASYIRIELGGTTLAKHIDTDNYTTCVMAFERARKRKVVTCIDGHTGAGKSYAALQYKQMNSKNTFLATCDADMNAKDFMNEVAAAVGLVNMTGTRYEVRKKIVERIRKHTNPLLIIDESENMRDANWGSIKRIIDDLIKHFAGITIIGANNFKKGIQNKAAKEKKNFPQINRRLKQGGFFKLQKLEVADVKEICADYNLTGWEKILFDYCDNMGELTERIIDIKEEYKRGQNLTHQEIEEIVFGLWD